LPPAGYTIPPHIVFIAGTIEFIGGLLVMMGLWTRWAAFICSGKWYLHTGQPMQNMDSFLFLMAAN